MFTIHQINEDAVNVSNEFVGHLATVFPKHNQYCLTQYGKYLKELNLLRRFIQDNFPGCKEYDMLTIRKISDDEYQIWADFTGTE